MAPENYCVKTMRPVDRFQANTARIQMELKVTPEANVAAAQISRAFFTAAVSHERLRLAYSLKLIAREFFDLIGQRCDGEGGGGFVAG